MSNRTRPSSSTAAAGWSARYSSMLWESRSGVAASTAAAMRPLPALACAQVGDVRGVVAAVPFVHGQRLGQILPAQLGMVIAPLEVLFRERFQQRRPARMQR